MGYYWPPCHAELQLPQLTLLRFRDSQPCSIDVPPALTDFQVMPFPVLSVGLGEEAGGGRVKVGGM